MKLYSGRLQKQTSINKWAKASGDVRGQAVELPGIEGVPSYGQGQGYCNPAQQMMLQQVLWNCLSLMVQRNHSPY